jgi:hypothetical protein
MKVKNFLERNIPGITVGGAPARGTGAFEIEDAKSGYVFHSKMRGGGFPDASPYVMQTIGRNIRAEFEARQAAMDSSAVPKKN